MLPRHFSLLLLLAGAVSAPSPPVCLTASIEGPIENCCIDAATVDAANARSILPLLDSLVKRCVLACTAPRQRAAR